MDSDGQWRHLIKELSSRPPLPDAAGQQALLRDAVRLGETVSVDGLGCSITQRTSMGYDTPVASNALALQLDLAQYEADNGPCVAACRDGRSHEIDVMADDDAYTHFAAVAVEHGVRSSLSLPVSGGVNAMALNLYASSTSAFQPRRVRAVADFLARCVASILAVAPASGVADTSAVLGGTAAIAERRELISRAQGVLLRGGAPDAGAAFTALTRQSRRSGRSVFAVAQDVIVHGPSDPGVGRSRS